MYFNCLYKRINKCSWFSLSKLVYTQNEKKLMKNTTTLLKYRLFLIHQVYYKIHLKEKVINTIEEIVYT